jgi:two-component system, NarL family, sensor histidine kinase DesK
VDIQTQPPAPPPTAAEAEWVAEQRSWTRGWRERLMLGLPLIYLVYLGAAVSQNSHGAEAVAGYLILAAFVVGWLLVPNVASGQWFWPSFGVLTALFLAELPVARAAAFVMCVFLTMLAVGRLERRAIPLVIMFAVAALVVPVAITPWHVSLDKSFDDITPVAIPVVAVVMFGAMRLVKSNQALAEARAELTMLAAENERIRIARDLHDLLGHSLTAITVKAGLARRLGAVDPAGAIEQIAEVESLSRRSLSEMRAAVSNYRDVTLATELATGRELLRAAGIVPDLPRAVDVVDPEHAELFGWVVREALTNVIRHARATTCTVRLSENSVEVVDDGVGAPASAGNGLAGLRERVTAAGGVLDAGPVQPKGWRLRVALAATKDTLASAPGTLASAPGTLASAPGT